MGGPAGIAKPTQQQTNLANKWKNFYSTTGGEATEKLKSFTQDLRGIDFIKPSEEWTNASTRDKFTNKLPETILNIGPGVVSSLAMFAVNPPLGFAVSAGSVADELKTIAMEEGVGEERAELLGLGTGLLFGWLDKIVPDEVFSPQQKKTFVSGFAKRILKTGLKEAGTEVLQEDIQLLAEATVREDITTDEVIVRNLTAGLGGVLGGVGAQTTTSFVNGIRSGDIAGLEDEAPVIETPIVPQTTQAAPVEGKKPPESVQVEEKVPAKPEDSNRKAPIASTQTVSTKTKKAVTSQVKEVKIVSEKSVQNVKNIKDVKTTLKTIRQNFVDLTSEVEGKAVVAQTQRVDLNVKDINQLKRTVARSKKFQEDDIETIRESNTGALLNRVIEKVQEKNPNMC